MSLMVTGEHEYHEINEISDFLFQSALGDLHTPLFRRRFCIVVGAVIA